MTDKPSTQLLVVDSLQGLHGIEPVAARARSPSPLIPSDASMMDKLLRWESYFIRGQSKATISAVRSDWAQYIKWCEGSGLSPLPADLDQLESFIRNTIVRGRKRSTIDRYIYTIGLIHEAAGLANPFKDVEWKMRWNVLVRELREKLGNTRKQTTQMIRKDVDTVIGKTGQTPRDLRDAALISLASDTMMRESELVAVRVEDFEQNRHKGTWTIVVPFSKTDQAGTGSDIRFVSRETMERVRAWQVAAGIASGLLFRPIGGRRKNMVKQAPSTVRDELVVALGAQEVARIFRRWAEKANLADYKKITGHSTRVGTANDLAEDGYTDLQIAIAGGWKSLDMVRYYTRKSKAGRNAVADFISSRNANQSDAD